MCLSIDKRKTGEAGAQLQNRLTYLPLNSGVQYHRIRLV